MPPDSRRTTTLLCFGSGVFKTFVSLRKNIADRQVLYIAPEITGYAKQAFKAMRVTPLLPLGLLFLFSDRRLHAADGYVRALTAALPLFLEPVLARSTACALVSATRL